MAHYQESFRTWSVDVSPIGRDKEASATQFVAPRLVHIHKSGCTFRNFLYTHGTFIVVAQTYRMQNSRMSGAWFRENFTTLIILYSSCVEMNRSLPFKH